MVSCNDAMMQIAAKMGATTFTRYMTAFGFGQKTGIDLPGEADAKDCAKCQRDELCGPGDQLLRTEL